MCLTTLSALQDRAASERIISRPRPSRPLRDWLYVVQLYAGDWYLCAYTRAPSEAERLAYNAGIFETRAEAEAARLAL